MSTVTYNDLAKILEGFAKDLAKANACILGAIMSDMENPDLVFSRIKSISLMPAVTEDKIVHDYLQYVISELDEPGIH